MDPNLVDVSNQLRALAEADVRYLILHTGHSSEEQMIAWRDWLTFEPVHEDADLVVYHTDPRLGRDFSLAHKLTDDMGLIRVEATDERVLVAGPGVIGVDARWASIAPPGRDHEVCLDLVRVQGEPVQSQCWPLDAQRPSSQWHVNEVVRGEYSLHLDPFLAGGEHTLELRLVDSTSYTELGSVVTLGEFEVEALQRSFSEPAPAQPMQVQFGERILLRGYDLHALADSLELVLYWQARERVEGSYKVFVHLLASPTAAPVAQSDSVPRQWTYPTDWWESGEVVEDAVTLSLEGVSPGSYLLVVGLYEAETGVRLTAYSGDGEQQIGDSVTLTEVQR